MLRLTKYFKPYLWQILLTVALLFVQANADLALPDYLSKIVNNGIQQGGIVDSLPTVIRKSQMDRAVLFLSASDRDQILAAYTLVDSSSENYAQVLKDVPGLAKEPVYTLNTLTTEQKTALEKPMAQALLAVSIIEQAQADPTKIAEIGKASGFNLAQLPAGTDLFGMLAQLSTAMREKIAADMQTQFAALGDSAVKQAAVVAVKAEYAALGMNTGSIQTTYILHTGLLMLAVSLVSVLCTIAVGFLSARAGSGLARDLRSNVFKKVESFSNAEFDHFSTASLITRTTNDITQVQMVVILMLRMVLYAPIVGVGGIVRALNKASSMWWLIAIAVVMLLSLVIVIFSLSLPKFKIMQTLIDRLNLVVRENLSGLLVIRAFNRQAFEEQRFDAANQNLTGTTLFVNRVMSGMFPSMMVIMNGLSLLIIWIGSHEVAQARMQVGDMMAFMQYAIQIVFSFLMMSLMFIFLPRASVSAGRIAEVLETQPSIRDNPEPRAFPAPFKGTVEFRNVSFRYPGADEDVLHDISFTARPGQTTAIIGSTGSGKSTVVNLIPRFYDVTDGAILIDGEDVREVTQHDLRGKIGYIPQKATLFTGTIDSNLRYADEDASQTSLRAAIETAQVTELIDGNEQGMDQEISQGGMNVSGGQKQRLSIARALVKRAPIYIFDDSFSALDFKTDAALRRALKKDTADSTLLIVTQRVSTVKNAEQIVVLDEGKIVGMGTHSELMNTCETYREIALSQLSMEELQ
ncbi:ABC-type multidrug transport system, ATPase and permease component [Longilinea arvoryzae]|uniref:ABC-type multidrug transport system, ATPase and permease component n=1 Tax=Longilinea arvoryzae TaxID=360412 RepID=A0A0K8MY09_9CHLR|nr:ABC transporter ATP-binding protein [Longilinea arvoryzae]GAP16138.1 ABC-type multidrug transport system, ATPase and permease component [Longilinea arvoryzae]